MNELLYRLSKLKIFDPACGSGNFLIIAYKELRKLEIKIIQQLQALQRAASGFDPKSEQLSFIPKSQLSLAASFQVELFSRIQLNQFYGIELDDFAHEIAQLSLWLAEHQMNVEFKKEFGQTNPTLPLKEAGQITHGNACRLDWEVVCPKGKDDEIYILGNPPYLGGRMQTVEQKKDLELAFKTFAKASKVDYITCWFLKGSNYIKHCNSKYSFVTTNSICQGEQVSVIWKHILNNDLEIVFAYRGFRWENNAKKNAAVTVSIIGVGNKSREPKFIIDRNVKVVAQNISPYLLDTPNMFIEKRTKAISNLKKMEYGNMAIDGGHLILSATERADLVASYPQSQKFIRPIFGAQEYLNGYKRYCLWIKNEQLDEALEIPDIRSRIQKVKEKRINGNDPGVIELAKKPHQFREMKEAKDFALILPTVSSERRKYIPIGFINKGDVIIAPNQVIYDPELFLLGLISSGMHMVWMKTVAGRLKTDFRYSSSLVYNTFAFPSISEQRKQEITQCVFRILEERERHSEKTLAQLYDPNKMPEGLREAHRANDIVIEKCYRSKPFESDEERLEYLFKLYERMIEEEKEKGGLFEKQKKSKKVVD